MMFGVFYVTYKRPAILRKTIESTLNQTHPPDTLLIVDNGNSEETESVVRDFANRKVIYCPTGNNLGSAGGTAFGVKWLFENGCDWICCGDDDNPPITEHIFERLLKIAQQSESDVGGVGVVGARWNWSKGELVRFSDDQLNGILEVDFIGGNSLLLLPRKVVEVVGTPDSRLFFGYPDLEYCLRIRKSGYRLLVDTQLMREYRIHWGRVGIKIHRSPVPRRTLNAVWRDYYTTRNYIHMMRTTFQRSDLARRAVLKSILRIGNSWRRGPSYGLTFTGLQLRGIWDGYRNHLGKTIEPQPKEQSEI